MALRALLDVNTLIALIDTDHLFHLTAKAWVTAHGDAGWATCPLTQNGCIRIMSHASYTSPVAQALVMQTLQTMCGASAHRFFTDDLSLLSPAHFQQTHIHSPRQITDVYLLGLAVHHEARLVTFDQRIPLSAVKGAKAHHLVVL
ncbi:MAG: hypothetical protein RLZZ401_695 [Pseudomonadota bacterium]|jgi:toxin-antitoxin system PIN domain toxin